MVLGPLITLATCMNRILWIRISAIYLAPTSTISVVIVVKNLKFANATAHVVTIYSLHGLTWTLLCLHKGKLRTNHRLPCAVYMYNVVQCTVFPQRE